ncbi:MAG: D-glycero-beta-D-manno-heptose 1-phosphate adenylyltransferase [Sphingobacteriaceae bacterium]|nr:D-glycero-beta-D-manno-heptose 1-phosphate adenylyltransferase [Cytophagaceae bacterium]
MNTASKIKPLAEALECIGDWQAAGEQIVFTNGVFDIVHLGHIDYLEKAREKGDRLVLGLNTDASVRCLGKGSNRPVVNEAARARMVAAFQFVDAVILFDEDTPEALIEAVKPDILVKGDDYTVQTIVGADFVIARGGRVETIPLVKGYSTTALIQKIKESF